MKQKTKFLRLKDFDLGENWTDVYLEVKNIKKGDVFFECNRMSNHKLIALTSARRISDGFYVVAENVEGEKVEIFYSCFTSYPGPNFYKEPQYLTKVENELVYIIE